MNNLAFLVLLACPIIMGGLFYMLIKSTQNNRYGEGSSIQTKELQENINRIMKQNQQLLKEIEQIKRSK